MASVEVEKSYFTFARGINTEASLIKFPPDFSVDEENYDLKIDGSRRRRRGLGLEEDGQLISLLESVDSPNKVVAAFKWQRAANNPNINFVCIQLANRIYFFDDVNPLSDNRRGFLINLVDFKVPTSTDTEVSESLCDMSSGRGHLFVVGKHINPFWVKYVETDGSIQTTSILVEERDFEGIDDGVATTARPVSASSTHTYNLYNRGWKPEDIQSFRTGQGTEPSKAMVPWLGYRRITTSGVAEQDWTKQFSDDKLVAELFQDASAPQGHFIRKTFEPDKIITPGPDNLIGIVTWSISGTSPGTQTVTLETESAHGLSIAESFSVSNQAGVYYAADGLLNINVFSFNGSNTVLTVPDSTHITFNVTFPSDFLFWLDQYSTLGQLSPSLVDADIAPVLFRPRAVGFFAGRVWYAGTPEDRLSSKLHFSQIVLSDAQYGKCYQVADPTDERISDIVDTDGGVIVIPEANDIVRIVPYGSVLLVFASNGVWQIGGGQSGYFTATSYSVRKITEEGCSSPLSVVIADTIPYYCGGADIYTIVQDENTGFLVSKNLTEFTIHSLYNNVAARDKVLIQGKYDDLNKKIIWLYGESGNYFYQRALVLDIRLGAFVKHKYQISEDAYLGSIVPLKEIETGLSDAKLKYICITQDGAVLNIAEANNSTDYTDLGNAGEPLAYLLTGFEVLDDPSKYRYSPYIWVFQKKTETGFTEMGADLIPVGESSTKLQWRWDWADNTTSGKWGREQEVYRHRRMYQPQNEADTFSDGQPLVITKTKLRGRGRSSHLYFRSGIGKDSWILGWKVNYKVKLEK